MSESTKDGNRACGSLSPTLTSVAEKAFVHLQLPLIRFGISWASFLTRRTEWSLARPYWGLDGVPTYTNARVRSLRYGPEPWMHATVVEPTLGVADGVLFFIHGGGFAATDEIVYMHSVEYWARYGFIVVLVEYPMAPASPYPTAELAIIDAMVTIKKSYASACAGRHGLVLMGESAGGNLALHIAACLTNISCQTQLRQAGIRAGIDTSCLNVFEKDLPTVQCVVCLSGMLSRKCCEEAGVVNSALRFLWRCYDPTGKELAPFDDLLESGHVSEMPRTLMCCGTADFLVSNSTRVFRLMQRHGLSVECNLHEGAPHAYVSVATLFAPIIKVPWLVEGQRCAAQMLAFATADRMTPTFGPCVSRTWKEAVYGAFCGARVTAAVGGAAAIIAMGNVGAFALIVAAFRMLLNQKEQGRHLWRLLRAFAWRKHGTVRRSVRN